MKRVGAVSAAILYIVLFLQTVAGHALMNSTQDAQAVYRNAQGQQALSSAEKADLLGRMSEQEKINAFKAIPDAEKKDVFKRLSQSDKELMLKSVDDAIKRQLIFALSEDQGPLLQKARMPSQPGEPAPQAVLPEKGPSSKEAAEPSRIERILSGQFPTEISRELRQFGYDFFDPQVSTFAPVTNVPIGPDYVIGPGDSFTIHLWGKAENRFDVEVERDGRINLPQVGTVTVAGLRFEDLRPFLSRKFKEYYPDFNMSVTMGRLRTVEVFIVGEARKPGTYTVSSLSTVITSLYAAGGPSKNGSLRNVQVTRQGQKIKVVDLYDFLVNGSKKDDIRLQSQDTLFVPVLGPVVGVAGNVRRPAIYEMRGGETIGDAIGLAGGVLPTGELQNVVVERMVENRKRVIGSFNLDPSSRTAQEDLRASLQDGDVIKIYPIHGAIGKVVRLEGHVKYPREYEWRPDMRLRDIIPSFGALLPEPYLPQAEIIRLIPPDSHPEIIPFNLGALLSGDVGQNHALQDMDRVIVYGVWEKKDKPEVTIKGAVRKEGTYPLYKGMTVKDLIFQAGNLSSRAFMQEASLSRVVAGTSGTDTVKVRFSPGKALEGDQKENIALQADDQVFVREIPKYSQALERKIHLEGEFLFPGEHSFSEGERLSSIIERAGGLTQEAYPYGAVFMRESAKEVQQKRMKEYIDKLEEDILTSSAQSAETAMTLDKDQAALLQQNLAAKKQLLEKLRKAQVTGRMVIDMEEVLALPSSAFNFELRPGDRLIVPKRPDYVNVMGEVYNPTALFAEKDKSVDYYLSQVGGPSKDADTDQIYVVKANGSVVSRSQNRFFGMVSWNTDKKRWTMGGFNSMSVAPGDTIIVPKETLKYPWLGIVKSVTEIMYQIAVAAGVLVVAF